MTHESREESAEGGEPVELYEFMIGTALYRYTSAQDGPVTFNLQEYEAWSFEHPPFTQTGELSKNDTSLTVPGDFPIARMFLQAPPSDVVLLTVFEFHLGETQRAAVWSGRVLNAEWNDADQAVLTCENVYTSLRRPGLRRKQGAQCAHVLYGNACKVANTSFQTNASIASINGATLTSPQFGALPAGWLPGGYVEYESSPGVVHRRAIRSQAGDVIVLSHPIVGIESGESVQAFPGCDHTPPTCQTKFNNYDNYGGFPHPTAKNPFGSSSIW